MGKIQVDLDSCTKTPKVGEYSIQVSPVSPSVALPTELPGHLKEIIHFPLGHSPWYTRLYVWQPFRLATPLSPKTCIHLYICTNLYKSPVVCTSLSRCQSSNTIHLISICCLSINLLSFRPWTQHTMSTIIWTGDERKPRGKEQKRQDSGPRPFTSLI